MVLQPDNHTDILILDVETTGLDVTYDCLLEIAFIPAQLTTSGLDIDYSSAFNSIIQPYKFGFSRMYPKVQQMHKTSGLLDELDKAEFSLHEVEFQIVETINSIFGVKAKNIQLCGNSIHFDRSFIKHDLKQLESRLSYRMLDMTPYRTLRNTINNLTEQVPKHRALDDCKYSATLLQEFYEVICKHTKC